MKPLQSIISICLLAFVSVVNAAPAGVQLDAPNFDSRDLGSLQRGAQVFMNYCMGCHSASLMRYNRMAADLGLDEDLVRENLMFVTDAIGDTMSIAMRSEDAAKWFGVAPPDLSVISRAKGVDYLYTYLRTYYLDNSSPLGTNNLAYPNSAMPHVLWAEQGYLSRLEDGSLTSGQAGSLSAREYDQLVRDLVNFLDYVGEPFKLQRLELGKWVLIYLFIFFIIAYLLKRAYWKDVH